MTPTPVADLRPLAFSLRGAGDLLGLSKDTVRGLCLAGELRHRKVGRRFVIPYSALEEFLAGADHVPSAAAGPTPAAEVSPESERGEAGPARHPSPTSLHPDHVVVSGGASGGPLTQEAAPGVVSAGGR